MESFRNIVELQGSKKKLQGTSDNFSKTTYNLREIEKKKRKRQRTLMRIRHITAT